MMTSHQIVLGGLRNFGAMKPSELDCFFSHMPLPRTQLLDALDWLSDQGLVEWLDRQDDTGARRETDAEQAWMAEHGERGVWRLKLDKDAMAALANMPGSSDPYTVLKL